MSDFLSNLQAVENAVLGAARGVKAKFDSWTFRMLINCLKNDDPTAVSEAIDQLAKEKRPISIPPLFVVARGHPNQMVRERAESAIKQLDEDNEVEELTA